MEICCIHYLRAPLDQGMHACVTGVRTVDGSILAVECVLRQLYHHGRRLQAHLKGEVIEADSALAQENAHDAAGVCSNSIRWLQLV